MRLVSTTQVGKLILQLVPFRSRVLSDLSTTLAAAAAAAMTTLFPFPFFVVARATTAWTICIWLAAVTSPRVVSAATSTIAMTPASAASAATAATPAATPATAPPRGTWIA